MISPHPTLHFRPVSDITARNLAFLWQSRLPFGKLAILDGDPGLGKSLVTLDLCARVTKGRCFPDGTPGRPAANVIILNAEDASADTIAPRLRALAADLDRVFILHGEDDAGALPLRLPTHIAALDHILTTTHAKLVVIDPIVAYLDAAVMIACDQSVRQALACLARLAQKHDCVILLVRHLNKRGGHRSLYRGGGSIGFLAACRTAWLIAEEPDHPGHRVLAQIKNNVAPPQPSLAFQILAEEGQPPVVSWLSGTRPFTADQFLAKAGQGPVFGSALARACDFLTGFLDEAPRTAREVWTAAEQEPLSERTLRRARTGLGIRSVRVAVNRSHISYWLLPGQEMPKTVPPEIIVPDLEPWLAPLREQFPPSHRSR